MAGKLFWISGSPRELNFSAFAESMDSMLFANTVAAIQRLKKADHERPPLQAKPVTRDELNPHFFDMSKRTVPKVWNLRETKPFEHAMFAGAYTYDIQRLQENSTPANKAALLAYLNEKVFRLDHFRHHQHTPDKATVQTFIHSHSFKTKAEDWHPHLFLLSVCLYKRLTQDYSNRKQTFPLLATTARFFGTTTTSDEDERDVLKGGSPAALSLLQAYADDATQDFATDANEPWNGEEEPSKDAAFNEWMLSLELAFETLPLKDGQNPPVVCKHPAMLWDIARQQYLP